MVTRAARWGNSLAIRVTRQEAEQLHLEENTPIKKYVVDGKLIIEPVIAPFYTLDDLLAGVTPANVHAEADSGYALGNEVW